MYQKVEKVLKKGEFPPCGVCKKNNHLENDCYHHGKPQCTNSTCREGLSIQKQEPIGQLYKRKGVALVLCMSNYY